LWSALDIKNTGDGYLYPYKGFRKNMGTGFTFCLALNVRKQRKTVPILKLPLQECPLNASRVPFFAFQFSKIWGPIAIPVFGLFLPPQNHETIIKATFKF
jgi:hypothetical protein